MLSAASAGLLRWRGTQTLGIRSASRIRRRAYHQNKLAAIIMARISASLSDGTRRHQRRNAWRVPASRGVASKRKAHRRRSK